MPLVSLKIIQDDGAVTRKVKLDSRMTIKEAHKVVKDKVIVPDPKKKYALFLRATDGNLAGIWLQDDKTLEYYMLKDGDSLDYICTVRNLRIRLLDGTVKTLLVDEPKSVGELMADICARLGITNYDEYGLCREEKEVIEAKEAATGTLTLRKKQPQPTEEDAALKQLCIKLKTDDNVDWLDQHRTLREQSVDSNDTLLLKRRLFYSDRNVDSRDPVQLHLLYVQTRDAILVGRHPVTEQQAAECKVRWINIRDVHRRILKKSIADPTHPPKQYKYDAELEFMKKFYRDIAYAPSLEEETEMPSKEPSLMWEIATQEPDNGQNSDDSDVPIKKVKTKKRKSKKKEPCFVEVNQTMSSFSDTQTSELDATDNVDAFLLSIGATLKTFNPYHLNLAKSKIFAVVQDHDLQQIIERQKVSESEGRVSTSEMTF